MNPKLIINGIEVEKEIFAQALKQEMDEVFIKFGPKGKDLISNSMGNPLALLSKFAEIGNNPIEFILEMHIKNNTTGHKSDV